jgi:hypothetical protein
MVYRAFHKFDRRYTWWGGDYIEGMKYLPQVIKPFQNYRGIDTTFYPTLVFILIGGFPLAEKNSVLRVVTPFDCCKNRRFRGTYRLHHQGDKNW